MLLSYFVEPIRLFLLEYPYLGLLCLIPFIIITLVVSCKPSIAHSRVSSFTFLTVLTVLMCIFFATFCVRFAPFAILVAMGLTAVVVLALIIFAFQAKYDFTSWVVYLFVVSLIFLITIPVGLFFRNKALTIIYAGIGALFCCIYIVIDVQMIVGGGRKVEFTVDDYCIASICLYTDIVSLFMDVLRLISS